MIVVIIAGGSGTRLWPLSTPNYPKQLLKVGDDQRSLIQNTFDRALLLGDKVYVVSEASHIQHVKDQLPELPEDNFIVEPARRGTASCIIAALVHISKSNPSDEPIAFLSADHNIRDTHGFVHSFKIAGEVSRTEQRLVLVGIEPDEPATGFGYIRKGDIFAEDTFVFNVHSFKEKPDYDTAKQYLASGNYLWNSGYFVGSIDTFKAAMAINAPGLSKAFESLCAASADEYVNTYLQFENISIDYALIEKVSDLLVVPASFDWMDLGSFADWSKAVESDASGNHCSGAQIQIEEVDNTFVHNTEDKPIAIIGLDNCVVINTPHGILVARKDMSQKVGDVSKRFNS